MVKGMQHRGVVLPHGLIFFCIVSLFVLGLFVVPAGAQQTSDPIAGQTVFIEVGADGTVNSIGPIAVADCTVARDATIVVEDEGGTQVELVNGVNATITGTPESITIEGTGTNGTFDNLRPTGGDEEFGSAGATDDGTVVSSTGIECGGTGGDGGNGADSGGNEADNAQYRAEDKEITVLVETIPDKKILVDTGGPSLVMIGMLVLALGFVGLGILLLRRV
jgi:hypothetical protein